MHFTKLRFNGLTVVDFPIVNALPSDLFILKNVDGLGPPEVDVSIADTLNAGGVYQGRRPQSREIVALVGLNPDYSTGQTASDLRTSLYGMLTPGYADNITIQIMDDDDVIAETTGYVSKLEINPFSKDPEVQVTVACLQQYLLAPEILFIEPADKAVVEIENVGTAPAGFHMEFIFTDDVSAFSLTDPSFKELRFIFDFLTGDMLQIDTRPGFRGVWLTRAGDTTNIIYSLVTDSVWYMLHGGLNTFNTSSQDFDWGDVYYQPQYWGI
jgi:hypothetical protein